MVFWDQFLSDGTQLSSSSVETYVDSFGTKIEYVHRKYGSQITVIWLSAFTKGPILGRYTKFSPSFNGFKLSRFLKNVDWILIRDNAGLTGDGTYYGGNSQCLFVENAVLELINTIKLLSIESNAVTEFVCMGSSMGGYGAIKMAILAEIPQVFVFSPHLDMRIAMENCGRGPWIKHCLVSDDPVKNEKYLLRLQDVVAGSSSLPRLVMQVSKDDPFVYPEQVLPFQKMYTELGGKLEIDLRDFGGHGSVNTPDAYIKNVVCALGNKQEIDFEELKKLDPRQLSTQEKIERCLQLLENKAFSILRFFRFKQK